jgi:hypothetical protein
MSSEEVKAKIVTRLRSRRDEIEKAILYRIRHVAHRLVAKDVIGTYWNSPCELPQPNDITIVTIELP